MYEKCACHEPVVDHRSQHRGAGRRNQEKKGIGADWIRCLMAVPLMKCVINAALVMPQCVVGCHPANRWPRYSLILGSHRAGSHA